MVHSNISPIYYILLEDRPSTITFFFFFFQMRIRKMAPKILQLLQEWTETFSYDFRDERMMRSLKELTQRLSSGDEVQSQSKFIQSFVTEGKFIVQPGVYKIHE